SSRRRAHASVRGRRRGRHTMLSEGTVDGGHRLCLPVTDIPSSIFCWKGDVLRVECAKCARKGRYSVSRLIEKYRRKGNMMKWKEQLNGDPPERASVLPSH